MGRARISVVDYVQNLNFRLGIFNQDHLMFSGSLERWLLGKKLNGHDFRLFQNRFWLLSADLFNCTLKLVLAKRSFYLCKFLLMYPLVGEFHVS